MKYFVTAFVALALLAGPKTLFSAEKAKETPKPARAVIAAKVVPNAVNGSDNELLKDVKFHDARLSEVVDYLRASCPRFKMVVVPDPQCPDLDPALPDIELKEVDLWTFVGLLEKAVPQLKVDDFESQTGVDIHLFKLTAPAGTQAPRLQVYRLSHLFPEGAGSQGTRGQAMADILSLVQAALEAQGSAKNVLMKVHEPTETLIFRGNKTQTEVVESALKALEPTKGEKELAKLHEQMQAEHDRMQEKLDQLGKRSAEAEVKAHNARQRIAEQATEIETLKARLQQIQTEKKP